MNANQVLHWPLDRLDQGTTIVDITQNRLNGTYAGNPQVVPDEKFGSCLRFDGDGDSLTTPDQAALRLTNYTVEVWIKPVQSSTWHGIVGKPGRNYHIWLNAGGYIYHRFHTENSTDAGGNGTGAGSIVWGQWYHVAITNDGQTAYTYINGVLKEQVSVTGGLVVDNRQLIVGRNPDDNQNSFYKGDMAHLRLYDNVLTLDEIRRDMVEDESAASAFVRSHPIDFELYNQDNHHVLFIDSATPGQTISLDILNSSRQNIALQDLGQAATPQAHHFELRFRPETLARASLSQIAVATTGWSLDRNPDGTALYLLRQGASTLNAGDKLTLQLTGMSADGRGGTRGTRVELVYNSLNYVGETAQLTGARLQFLDIINHQGRRNVPLHVGFVGSDTVLSDGSTANTLKLRIANLSRDRGLRLNQGNATTPPSRFRLSCDVQAAGETREWALVDHSTVDGMSLRVSQTQNVSANWAAPTKRNLGQSVEWTVTPGEDTTLQADGYIVLELSTLVALASIGHANLYINFENIPGYQDEQMVVVVQKSPLLYSNNKVGIGTNSPEATLQIIDTNQEADGKTLVLGPTSQSNLRLGYHQDYSWIQSHGGKPLAINPILNDKKNQVGIGTTTPKAALHVAEDLALGIDQDNKKFIIHSRTHQNGDFLQIAPDKTDGTWDWSKGITLKRDGHIGIGTVSPGDYKLNVSGGNTYLGGTLTVHSTVTATSFEGEGAFVTGMIVMWSGAANNIPTGWALCNGQNNTPDLRDRFLVGAGSSYAVGATGGANQVALNYSQMPAHSHGGSISGSGIHRHVIPVDQGSGGGLGWSSPNAIRSSTSYFDNDGYPGTYAVIDSWAYTMSKSHMNNSNKAPSGGEGEHSHSVSIGNAGGGSAHENRPLYYAICFIMKV